MQQVKECERYRLARRQRGTQHEVAKLLGIHRLTLSRRENGKFDLTEEMWMALRTIPVRSRMPQEASEGTGEGQDSGGEAATP